MKLDILKDISVNPIICLSSKEGVCNITTDSGIDSYFYSFMKQCKAKFSFDPYVYFLPFDCWDVEGGNLEELLKGIEPEGYKKTQEQIFDLLEPLELRLNLLLHTFNHEYVTHYPSLETVSLKIPNYLNESLTRKIIQLYETFEGNISQTKRKIKIDEGSIKKVWRCFGLHPIIYD